MASTLVKTQLLEREALAPHNRDRIHGYFYKNDPKSWPDMSFFQELISSVENTYSAARAAVEFHKTMNIISKSPGVPEPIARIAAEQAKVRRVVLQRRFREIKRHQWKQRAQVELEDLNDTLEKQSSIRAQRKTAQRFDDGYDNSSSESAGGDWEDSEDEGNDVTQGSCRKINNSINRESGEESKHFKRLRNLGPFGPPSSSSDSSYVPEDTTEENLMAGIVVDRLVGPGCKSSALYCDHWILDGFNLSNDLMEKRRTVVQMQDKLQSSSDILQLNFIFTSRVLREVLPSHLVSLLSPPSLNEVAIAPEFTSFCQIAISQPLSNLDANGLPDNSILGRFVQSHLLSGQLWAAINYDGVRKGNEDTFTMNVVMPWVLATFSQINDLVYRWRGDQFVPGHSISGDAPREFPDMSIAYNLGTSEGYLLLMEVKPPGASQQLIVDDEVKLINMMKGALDAHLERGYDVTICGLLVQGYFVRLLEMSIDHEAIYIVSEHGRFRCPSNTIELPLAITMLPVLERLQARVLENLAKLQGPRPKDPLKTELRRPSFLIVPSIVTAASKTSSKASSKATSSGSKSKASSPVSAVLKRKRRQ
ncbi:hypothetical protein BGX27_002268 [Mortierella sp. AM989]|nr:hypothetical protein BGX27_002268 [Mortierella sp. AM989]